MAGSLDGRRIAVTGGSSGIGRATALRLGADGAAVAVNYIGDHAPAADVVRRLDSPAVAVPGDVADEAAVREMYASAEEGLGGPVDLLVNNAGVEAPFELADLPLAEWERVLSVNLTGPFLCAKAAIPHLRQNGGGAIVAVSSGAGKQGYPQLGAYSASKFGLMGLMQGLAAEVADDGIKVCTIVPGSILTSFGGRSVTEKRDAMASDPGRKYLYPEDVAEAILFLLRQPRHAWTQELNLWPF